MIESLREVLNDEDKSGARILFAIFFWFLGYSAVETFFTLYAQEHLGIDAGDGATLLSVFPLFFVLFAIPSGFIAARIGRRVAISIGLIVVAVILALFYILPARTLLAPVIAFAVRWHPIDRRRSAHVDNGGRNVDLRRDRLGIREYQFAADGC